MAARQMTGRTNTSTTGTAFLKGQTAVSCDRRGAGAVKPVMVEQTVISQLAEVLFEGVSLQQKCSGFSFFSQLFVELQLLPENNLKLTMVTSHIFTTSTELHMM